MSSMYERVLNLRNRISLDGDDTIYDEDHLLLDEVLDYIESNEQKGQEETYNDTVDIYKELEAGAIIKKQEELLKLYRQLVIDLGLVIENDFTDRWSVSYDYEYLEINEKAPDALNTYKKIKELEE